MLFFPHYWTSHVSCSFIFFKWRMLGNTVMFTSNYIIKTKSMYCHCTCFPSYAYNYFVFWEVAAFLCFIFFVMHLGKLEKFGLRFWFYTIEDRIDYINKRYYYQTLERGICNNCAPCQKSCYTVSASTGSNIYSFIYDKCSCSSN